MKKYQITSELLEGFYVEVLKDIRELIDNEKATKAEPILFPDIGLDTDKNIIGGAGKRIIKAVGAFKGENGEYYVMGWVGSRIRNYTTLSNIIDTIMLHSLIELRDHIAGMYPLTEESEEYWQGHSNQSVTTQTR